MPENNNASLAPYLAGLFDGEGSVQVNVNCRKSGKYFRMQVSISNNEIAVLDELCAATGLGVVRSYEQKYWRLKIKTADRMARRHGYWRMHGKDAEQFLRLVVPFLRIKRQRAELALQFRDHVRSTRGQYRLSQEDIQVRNDIFNQMKALNARGLKGHEQRDHGVVR